MKVSNISVEAQMNVLSSHNINSKVLLAKSTESPEVQAKLIEEANPRVLVALASNPNLSDSVVLALSELAARYPGVGTALVSGE